MNIEDFRAYCLAKKGVTEDFPFDQEVLALRVMGKIFALTSIVSKPFRVNLKMDKELVEEYREKYEDVLPGYHMNKAQWNTVYFDTGTIPKKELLWMTDHSYDEVVKKLKKKEQELLK